MENSAKNTPSSQSILEQISTLIREEELLLLVDFLKQLPVHSSTDVKPYMISYNIYKISSNEFEMSCTADGWVTANTGTKSLALFLFNKIDHSFFTWE